MSGPGGIDRAEDCTWQRARREVGIAVAIAKDAIRTSGYILTISSQTYDADVSAAMVRTECERACTRLLPAARLLPTKCPWLRVRGSFMASSCPAQAVQKPPGDIGLKRAATVAPRHLSGGRQTARCSIQRSPQLQEPLRNKWALIND